MNNKKILYIAIAAIVVIAAVLVSVFATTKRIPKFTIAA